MEQFEVDVVNDDSDFESSDDGLDEGEKKRKNSKTIRAHSRPIHDFTPEIHPDDLKEMRRNSWARKALFDKYENPKAPVEYRPYFIWLISAVDVIMFIIEIIVNRGFEDLTVNPLWGPGSDTLLDMGAKYGPKMRDGEVWRFFTPIFLHVGVWHLAFNCCTQWRVGIPMERRYGFFRIIPVYFLSGITGNLVSAIFLPEQIQVGASGAIFGLIGIMGVDLIENWKYIASPLCFLFSYIFSVTVAVLIGLLPGIDNFAHIGGFVQGIIAGIIVFPRLGKRSIKRSGPWRIICALSLIPFNILALIAGFLIFYLGVDVDGWCSFCQWINCVPIADWCDLGEINDD